MLLIDYQLSYEATQLGAGQFVRLMCSHECRLTPLNHDLLAFGHPFHNCKKLLVDKEDEIICIFELTLEKV